LRSSTEPFVKENNFFNPRFVVINVLGFALAVVGDCFHLTALIVGVGGRAIESI
jgi:hypothetical protein